jgi:phosphoglycolate phosphatase-like HAD superfamily hydrolase
MGDAMTPGDAGIEVVRRPAGRRFRVVLFDFDGTLSLLRHGWQGVMIPMMVEVLAGLPAAPGRDALRRLVTEDVDETTGLPTICQMRRLAERVRGFGGEPHDPKAYKREYLRRLDAHIRDRREGVAAGRVPPDAMLLAGARALLEALAGRGLALCLASGTDEPDVRREARLLGVDRYFGARVYGARDDAEASGKSAVIGRLLAAEGAGGGELLVLGDGFVEIAEGRQAGGYAVAVASDEAAGGGRINAWKRERLLRAGADAVVADFTCREALLRLLFGA